MGDMSSATENAESDARVMAVFAKWCRHRASPVNTTFLHVVEVPENKLSEIIRWLNLDCDGWAWVPGGTSTSVTYRFTFRDAQQALLFKLTFGGS